MADDGVVWSPQVGPQSDASAARTFCDELMYGGAVFGGKTDFLLGDFATDVGQGKAWAGILFRQSFPELEEVIERSMELYSQMGAEYQVGTKTWRWPSGALLRLRSLDTVDDFTKYMGFSYAWIGWDELPLHASMKPYHRMKSRLRGPGRHKRIRATGNPGGRCHSEIKEYFGIGTWPKGYHLIPDAETGMSRMFIPSRVRDNQIGLSADPGYVDRLKGVGDPELVKSWLDGDWDSVVGAYFGMFRRSAAEVEPFEIPQNWPVFTCGDYGEVNPTWWGIIAVDSDDDVWVVDEYYRAGAGGADHARGIRDMVANCPYIRISRPRLNLAPADMWTKRRPGEASQALAPQDSFAKLGVHLTRANMDRVNGWRNLKDLMYASRIKFFKGRTSRVLDSIASVMRDEHNPEDVLKGGDDHPADGLRYGINHVYKARKAPESVPTGVGSGQHLLDMIKGMGDLEGRGVL